MSENVLLNVAKFKYLEELKCLLKLKHSKRVNLNYWKEVSSEMYAVKSSWFWSWSAKAIEVSLYNNWLYLLEPLKVVEV